ncbi:MAG: enhanced serine sensitivity protein SseB C-terminal domain-containing protein, partial [Alphaproteobacteria bacterium]|nr:enhanced serine sensitivity protein SseB C-terminal domain-containing protein [Alphaproteobacteria bacterium]
MPFISENELEKALVKAAKEPAAAPDFYRLLLESNLLVMGTAEGLEEATEEFSLSPGGKLNLVTGLKDGAQYLPVFSSLPRMQEFVKTEAKFLSIRGRDLLDITRGAPVILNPASEYGKEFTTKEILELLDGPGAGVPQYALDEEYPAVMVETLSSVFKTRSDVIAAWMIKVNFSDRGGERHPLVGIETSGDWPSLMQAI